MSALVGIMKFPTEWKVINILVGVWATPLKNMKVGWDYYYSHYMEKEHMFQTTNQYGGGL